jgi:hypothetical protein
MEANKKPTAPNLSEAKFVGRHRTRDSAGHLLAASPVLMAIANWTGKIGTLYIKRFVLSGKIKEARRNGAVIAAVIALVFLLIIACAIWLALL